MKSRILLSFLAISLLAIRSEAQVETDFMYRPYPTILVHGFNAMADGWGVETAKTSKTQFRYSTHILGFTGPTVGNTLVSALSPSGNLEQGNPMAFPDYYRSGNFPTPGQLKPLQEPGSQSGLDHTYVEVYGVAYYNESDDDAGTQSRKFEAYGTDPMWGFTLGVETPVAAPGTNFKGGGQTQILRTRVIQVLNEYYGNWKWVGDPTAKINIVCHSNGGLVTTNMLAEDEKYFSNGYTGGLYWNGITPGPGLGTGTEIYSTGFRLRDHVNQVVSLNTPYDGSPMASKKGVPSLFANWIVGSTLVTTELIPIMSVFIGTKFHWTSAAWLALTSAMLIKMQTEIIYQPAAGGSNTPVIKDLKWHDSVIKKYAGQTPTRSDGTPIPYTNFVGEATHFELMMIPLMFTSAAYAAYFSIGGFWNWSNWVRAGFCWTGFAGLASATVWLSASDGIVSKSSADMKSIFPAAQRDRRNKRYYFHTDTPKARTDIPPILAGKPEVSISHVIGEFQPTFLAQSNLPQLKSVDYWPDAHVAPTIYNNPVHDIKKFDGLRNDWPAGQEWKHWFNNQNNVIQTTAAGGRPNMLVGNLTDYYMNSAVLEYRQNSGNWTPLTYKTDFGNYSGRFVDLNGDGTLGAGDKLTGSLFFAPLSYADQCGGTNVIRVRVTNRKGEKAHAYASFVQGDALAFHEALDDGSPKVPAVFINKVMNWNIPLSEQKQLALGFETPFQASGSSQVSLESASGSLFLTQTSTSPAPGQFQIQPISGTSLHMIKVSMVPSQLKKENGIVTPDQMLNLSLQATNGLQTCVNIPFFIDNLAPNVVVTEPKMRNDYNEDGVIDGTDVCHETVNPGIPPTDCSTVCQGLGSTQECTVAKQTCQAINQSSIDVSRPDCDGIDNDFDGLVDAADISESNVVYYSPKYDPATGALTTPPVDISFKADDDISSFFPAAQEITTRIWKIYGQSYNPHADQLLYTATMAGEDLTYGKAVSTNWAFNPYTAANPPPDGLYAAVNTVIDQAGNTTVTAPGYFIVDTRNPSITINKTWQDDQGRRRFDKSSAYFGILFTPGTGSLNTRPFDSEADVVRVTLTPTGAWANLVDPYQAEQKVTYSDNHTYNASVEIAENGIGVPDGRIDPNRMYIPKLETNLGAAGGWYAGLFDRAVPDGSYTVSIETEDKAGNITTYNDPTPIVLDRGLDGPPLTMDPLGEDTKGKALPVSGDPNGMTVVTEPGTRLKPKNDEGTFADTKAKGNFEITFQMVTKPTTAGVQSGVMVRNSNDVNGPYVSVLITSSGQLVIQQRNPNTLDMIEYPIPGTYAVPNVFIKTKRQGDVITMSISTDGVTFTQVATYTIGSQDVYVGVYTSPDPTTTTTIQVRVNPGPGSIPPIPPAPSCLDKYTVYSNQQTVLADRAAVFGGGIGSTSYVEVGADGAIRGNVDAGGNLLLRSRAHVFGNVHVTGSLTRQDNTYVEGDVVTGSAITACSIPQQGTIPVGSQDVNLNVGQSLTLNPGNYGGVHAYANATLTLKAGTYNLKSLVLEPDVKVILNTSTGPIDIKVRDNLAFGDRFNMSFQTTGLASQVNIYSHQASPLRLGTDSRFVGRLTAPRADINVNSRGTSQGQATVYGVIYGNSVRFEPDVILDSYGALP
ncbi:MAG: hypothetical protein ABIW76_08200 [Fibrobacteria bacterium]